MVCFNLGYQGRSLAELCSTLSENAVKILIDVREHAWSQRPEFRRVVLQNTLASHGISYLHCKMAGNPFRPRNGERLDFKVCAERYERHLTEVPEVLDELESVIKNQRCALFCYERERNSCHRDILLNALSVRNPKMKIINL
ncbi:DUF488 domain-containing protein [candidate division KSB1 bacterium]|nr:DUF488 domain-containing protein [bacterium]NUM64907.1 DUF488 domain-containing protein [candidate division KSB1 bacterium]